MARRVCADRDGSCLYRDLFNHPLFIRALVRIPRVKRKPGGVNRRPRNNSPLVRFNRARASSCTAILSRRPSGSPRDLRAVFCLCSRSPPAENERSPPVGHRNVSEAAPPAACDKKRRHVETAGIGVLLSELT
jgi:hypothetical protein